MRQPRQVHPRAGGEHGVPKIPHEGIFGPSPRGRGTPGTGRGGPTGGRSIPARAGNTGRTRVHAHSRAVHPRAGGEHLGRRTVISSTVGPSPRGRGTLQRRRERSPGRRSIPARAGNTMRSGPRGRRSTVHPRAGGEHMRLPAVVVTIAGPSPRGRGTREFAIAVSESRRSIPARAGNTPSNAGGRPRCTVHPRAGGEHRKSCSSFRFTFGPSPRGRGTLLLALRPRPGSRSIPARAGNTPTRSSRRSSTPVHPRAGGEHFLPDFRHGWCSGPSPRGRGTLVERHAIFGRLRSIPARAGNTSAARRPPSRPPVHPRAGGEHELEPALGALDDGPSPRGRGTPHQVQHRGAAERSIPARAGNTVHHRLRRHDLPVHPRAGGEHAKATHGPIWMIGPSPRGRGTLLSY